MVREKNFKNLWEKLVEIIFVYGKIPDFRLMEQLGFSPPSWKEWKQKFIEKATYEKYPLERQHLETQELVEFNIQYVKKEKMWYKIDFEKERVYL